MIIGINCGHTVSGTAGSGAVGYLNESDETRAVGYPLMKKLRRLGHTVIDCTDDRSATVSDNLRKICDIANGQKLDMFLSIHFNSGGGKGCEAYTYGGIDKAMAGKMVEAMESAGFANRGIKDGSRLYVVRNTKAAACLLEVCFVDSSVDLELYRKLGGEGVADILCKAICGALPQDETETEEEGDIDMSRYEELKGMIEEIDRKLEKLENPMIYDYIDDNMPEWARATVQKLSSKGVLLGDGSGLRLNDEMLRMLVICDRAGIFDK